MGLIFLKPRCLNISIEFLPLAILIKFKIAIAKVLVLIPPPVEVGEAPIHIKSKIRIIVENCSSEKLIVLNPAVLVVIETKAADTNFPKPVCSFNVK